MKRPSVSELITGAVGIATLLLLFLGLTDKQIASTFFRVPEDKLADTTLLLSSAATVCRVLLLLFVVTIICFYIFHTRKNENKASAEGVLLLPEVDAVDNAIKYLTEHRDSSLLCIWGFGLSWARPLYQYLRGIKHSQLVIHLFIPADRVLDCGIEYVLADITSLKKHREATLEEWQKLAVNNMVRSVNIYQGSVLPNDLGLLIDDCFALIGTYKYAISPSGSLEFHPQPKEERLFLQCFDDCVTNKYLIKCLSKRSLCRRFDCIDIPLDKDSSS